MAPTDFSGFCRDCLKEVDNMLAHTALKHGRKYCQVCDRFLEFEVKGGQFNKHFGARHSQTHTCCSKSKCVLPITPKGEVHIHVVQGLK
ncbi:hypothetical protein RchiOBHm_Chr1g0324231 [Rosa chinensis]|uniref:Uncharacterized protein n=1 Tax=Rosa chinensis TaxID=74649 RepID=A0A2P6S9Q6_ROSCH|nr:hypothetical protein RchiOBHm_Chr1g0324231 [Rosa chinensis]